MVHPPSLSTHPSIVLSSPIFQLAASKGCQGIEPDNTDAWSNDIRTKAIGKFSIGKQDQLNFNKWIADTCHR